LDHRYGDRLDVVIVLLCGACRAAWEGKVVKGAGEAELAWMKALKMAKNSESVPNPKDTTNLT
jgi:hypothetical protein